MQECGGGGGRGLRLTSGTRPGPGCADGHRQKVWPQPLCWRHPLCSGPRSVCWWWRSWSWSSTERPTSYDRTDPPLSPHLQEDMQKKIFHLSCEEKWLKTTTSQRNQRPDLKSIRRKRKRSKSVTGVVSPSVCFSCSLIKFWIKLIRLRSNADVKKHNKNLLKIWRSDFLNCVSFTKGHQSYSSEEEWNDRRSLWEGALIGQLLLWLYNNNNES